MSSSQSGGLNVHAVEFIPKVAPPPSPSQSISFGEKNGNNDQILECQGKRSNRKRASKRSNLQLHKTSRAEADTRVTPCGKDATSKSPYLTALKNNSTSVAVKPSVQASTVKTNDKAVAADRGQPIMQTRPMLSGHTLHFTSLCNDISAKEKMKEKANVVESDTIKTKSYNQAASAWHDILRLKPEMSTAHYQSSSINPAVEPVLSDKVVIDQTHDIKVSSTNGWWSAIFEGDYATMQHYLARDSIMWDVTYNGELDREDYNKFLSLNALHILSAIPHGTTALETLLNYPAVIKHINVKDRMQKRNALHYAMTSSSTENLKILLNHTDIDKNARDKYGDTPLHFACRNDLGNHVTLLLEKCGRKGSKNSNDSLKVNIKNKKGQPALMLSNSRAISVLLIDYGADISLVDGDAMDALCYAVRLCHSGLLKALLNSNSQSFYRLPYLLNQTVEVLGNKSPDVPRNSSVFTTPMHQAALYGNYTCMLSLLQSNLFDINLQDEPHRYTPLMYSAREGFDEIFILLLTYRSNDYISPTDFTTVNNLVYNSTQFNIFDGNNLNEILIAAGHLQLSFLYPLVDFVKVNVFYTRLFNSSVNKSMLYTLVQYFLKQRQISLKKLVHDPFVSIFSALISGGMPLCLKFLEILSSKSVLEILSEFSLLNEESLQENWSTVPINEQTSLADSFPSLHKVEKIVVFGWNHGNLYQDLEIVLDGNVIVNSFTWLWRSRSDVINAMISSNLLPSRIDSSKKLTVFTVKLSGITIEVFELLSIYVNYGVDVTKCVQNMEILVELLFVSNEWLMTELQKYCEERIFHLREEIGGANTLKVICEQLYLPLLVDKLVSEDKQSVMSSDCRCRDIMELTTVYNVGTFLRPNQVANDGDNCNESVIKDCHPCDQVKSISRSTFYDNKKSCFCGTNRRATYLRIIRDASQSALKAPASEELKFPGDCDLHFNSIFTPHSFENFDYKSVVSNIITHRESLLELSKDDGDLLLTTMNEREEGSWGNDDALFDSLKDNFFDEEGRLRVYRAIVCKGSDKLEAMLHFQNIQRQEKDISNKLPELVLTGINSKILFGMVYFLYTGLVPTLFNASDLVDLAVVADEYLIPALCEQCITMLLNYHSKEITYREAIYIYKASEDRALIKLEKVMALYLIKVCSQANADLIKCLLFEFNKKNDEEEDSEGLNFHELVNKLLKTLLF